MTTTRRIICPSEVGELTSLNRGDFIELKERVQSRNKYTRSLPIFHKQESNTQLSFICPNWYLGKIYEKKVINLQRVLFKEGIVVYPTSATTEYFYERDSHSPEYKEINKTLAVTGLRIGSLFG